ncbi:hypothetical protein GJAV_G00164560 [Gymnothorax javanicus]|nr:hypothetical protein GJAV_G00164560 [Gymnothorax javanicus]
MPRYCAVKLCKNRGGVPSKDNKKISFYPFPLRDEARLQKWVHNMKRQEWTPSRHQYLCSDHFTDDSFDLRWGIRYLKHTAVPTIFPFIYEDEESTTQDGIKKLRCKKTIRPAQKLSAVSVKPMRTSSPPRKRALILKRELGGQSDDDSAGKTSEPVTEAADPLFSAVLLIQGHLDSEAASSLELSAAQTMASLPGDQIVTLEMANQQPAEERILVTSSMSEGLGGSEQESEIGSAVTVLCAETDLAFTSPLETSDAVLVATATDSAPSADSSAPEGNGEHSLTYEHSYCRQISDQKEQLWNKIAGLHLKITELERREEDTMMKIDALEGLVVNLRRDNMICEERRRALEDYFSSVLL